MPLVADGGRLATITGDPPEAQRGIEVVNAYVAPDGLALEAAARQLVALGLTIPVTRILDLSEAGVGLQSVVRGHAAGAAVLQLVR
jgi:hypothetical protein